MKVIDVLRRDPIRMKALSYRKELFFSMTQCLNFFKGWLNLEERQDRRAILFSWVNTE